MFKTFMSPKPKILVCINKLGSSSGLGGAERLVVDDINEMYTQGYPVCLLTLKKESEFSVSDELVFPKENCQRINFGSLFNFTDWLKVCKYIKKEKPDIVLTHLWFSNTILRVVCKIAGVKNVISFEHNVYDTVKTKKMYFMDKLLQRYCRKILAVSSAVKESLLKHGINEEKIVVVNNGIVISKYNKSFNSDLKEKLGIPKETFVFLSIGRLISQKGMDVLIRAFEKVSGNSVLLIVGQGPDENMLKKLAKDLNLENRVHFMGVRSDISDILSISDSFVLASRYEGLGIAVLEAMAGRKPIIISDFPAGKDMIESGKSGLVVERENEEDLAKAMQKIIDNPELRNNLADEAYKKVQEFSIEEHVNKILSL